MLCLMIWFIHLVELGNMKWSMVLFEIVVLKKIDIFMMRNSLEKMAN